MHPEQMRHCILCGDEVKTADRDITWCLCWRCTFAFSLSTVEELKAVYDNLRVYLEKSTHLHPTQVKALNSFLHNFLKPCLTETPDMGGTRQQLGLSTRQMAKKLGISHSMVIQIEKGKRPLSNGLVKKLKAII